MQCDVVVVVANVSFEAFNLGVKKRLQKEFRLAPSAGIGGQLLKVTCGISRNIGASGMSSQTNNERGGSVPEACTVVVVYILERVLEQVARAHRKQRSQTDVARRFSIPSPVGIHTSLHKDGMPNVLDMSSDVRDFVVNAARVPPCTEARNRSARVSSAEGTDI
ncbi:hypothetical protein Tco_1459431 [Tanacetum coccineum]